MTAIDFYQQHIKIIYGNILRLGAPFAAIIVVVMSLISDSREDFTSSYFLEPTTSTMLVAWVLILSLISVTFVILVYLLRLYDEGLINESGKLQLMEKLFPYSVKIFAVHVLVSVLSYAGTLSIVKLIEWENLFSVFLMIAVALFLIPLFTMVAYPVFFEEKGVADSISKGIRIGFQSWGPTFMTGLVLSIVYIIIFYIFVFIGILFAGIFSLFGLGWMASLSQFFFIIASLFAMPVPVLCFAFHYFSFREKTEGVSLKAQIDNFENL